MRPELPIARVEARAYRIPTDQPEADGTYAWNSTTLVTATVRAGEHGCLRVRPLSAHTAPSLHLHVASACRPLVHVEYARIESLLFDGFREPRAGRMSPDSSRPGLGLELKVEDAERFAIG